MKKRKAKQNNNNGWNRECKIQWYVRVDEVYNSFKIVLKSVSEINIPLTRLVRFNSPCEVPVNSLIMTLQRLLFHVCRINVRHWLRDYSTYYSSTPYEYSTVLEYRISALLSICGYWLKYYSVVCP
jgi:hypothetical protein